MVSPNAAGSGESAESMTAKSSSGGGESIGGASSDKGFKTATDGVGGSEKRCIPGREFGGHGLE